VWQIDDPTHDRRFGGRKRAGDVIIDGQAITGWHPNSKPIWRSAGPSGSRLT
jgi:hypothetical protein